METQTEGRRDGNKCVAGGKIISVAEQLYYSHENLHSLWLSLWHTWQVGVFFPPKLFAANCACGRLTVSPCCRNLCDKKVHESWSWCPTICVTSNGIMGTEPRELLFKSSVFLLFIATVDNLSLFITILKSYSLHYLLHSFVYFDHCLFLFWVEFRLSKRIAWTPVQMSLKMCLKVT